MTAIENRAAVADQERDLLKRQLDEFKRMIALIGQTPTDHPPDEHDVAVVRLAAAASMPDPGWEPVTLTVRGQKVIALVCNCATRHDGASCLPGEKLDPDAIYRFLHRVTRPLRRVI